MFNEPKTEKINLFGRDLLLSERTAGDVNRMLEFSRQKPNKNYQDTIFEGAIVVSDGLKINLKNIPFYKFLKKLKIKRLISVKSLLNNLPASTIFNLAKKVYELEGLIIDEKKKIEKPEQAEA